MKYLTHECFHFFCEFLDFEILVHDSLFHFSHFFVILFHLIFKLKKTENGSESHQANDSQHTPLILTKITLTFEIILTNLKYFVSYVSIQMAIPKGQQISKQNCRAVHSPKKQRNNSEILETRNPNSRFSIFGAVVTNFRLVTF